MQSTWKQNVGEVKARDCQKKRGEKSRRLLAFVDLNGTREFRESGGVRGGLYVYILLRVWTTIQIEVIHLASLSALKWIMYVMWAGTGTGELGWACEWTTHFCGNYTGEKGVPLAPPGEDWSTFLSPIFPLIARESVTLPLFVKSHKSQNLIDCPEIDALSQGGFA